MARIRAIDRWNSIFDRLDRIELVEARRVASRRSKIRPRRLSGGTFRSDQWGDSGDGQKVRQSGS